ncbi:hypothetical protein PAXRUDRAFT_30110 [Paxillus rubicundulus Ve08.2h10]|uniref:Magnesium transporter n=1 Tax=Paxillus rubicundulus Ve08.2h10 TaxID=930991 RepID=A0A0D0EA75_9AGAM|nr:hypothetical protein PAXRUDRAFT_30110 [Paxillus rubicundulus Ve08.2h10]
MPRENSFSDSEGRSLTPDLSDEESAASEHDVLPAVVRQPSPTPSASQAPQASKSPSERPRPSLVHPQGTPKDRFRASVKKVIQMQRTAITLSRYGGAGAEPGVDPRRSSAFLTYGHIKQNCVIELVDYSTVRASSGRMTNGEFVKLLNDKTAGTREPWVKVRWVNVCGISWDVISALAIHYDLHPLAVEDVLHQRRQARSKADYYPKHLFIRILSHTLENFRSGSTPDSGHIPEDMDEGCPPREPNHRASSPGPMTSADYRREQFFSDSKVHKQSGSSDEDRTVFGSAPGTWARAGRRSGIVKRRTGDARVDIEMQSGGESNRVFSPTMPATRQDSTSRRRRERAELTLEELKKDGRVNVKVHSISIFLLRNGTVISILPQNCVDFSAPIMARLRQPDTGLRTSADASLLVQSLLDLVVDSALEVVDAFHEKLLELERDILIKPEMKVVGRLHIISGDLTLHKRTLEPLKTLVYGLRRYDADRCAALVGPGEKHVKIEGFMSQKAKIYLADVHDHMEYILTSMDMFAGIAENLINYTFNIKSYEMNEVMRRLTLATIIFLPLTLLTGYFGMNFDPMWSVNFHSDVLFWQIAVPLMAVIVPVFTWPDIKRIAHYTEKRFAARKQLKTAKRKSA